MKNDFDILMMKSNVKDLGYTGLGDRKKERKIIFHKITSKIS